MPLVWVMKRDNSLRMCPDYKVHINEKLLDEQYPIPRIDEICSKLVGSKYFAKIDLKEAYWQIPLNEDSQDLCTINTSKGIVAG